jgi:pimeloyl-ACP methyl ester carboxylesterase
MFKARGDNVEIQVAEWEGAGETVLCIHGLTSNCRSFDVVAGGLTPRHRVLAMDLRGRGLSDKPDTGYSIDHHCRDIAAVAADLGLEIFHLLGHSLGAYIALAYAARHQDQVKGLILMDGGADLTPEQWGKVSAGIKPSLDRLGKVFPTLEAYLESVKQAPFLQPWNEAAESYFRYESEAVAGGRKSRINPLHVLEERGNLATFRPADFYPRIACPVLILRATEPMVTGEDHVLPAEAMPALLEALPQARLVNLPGMNHYSVVLQPCPPLTQAVLDFLEGRG